MKKSINFIFAILILTSATVAPIFAQTCQPAPVGLVSWWTADNNALDSRSRHNGTLDGGATFAAGQNGQAFSFPAQSTSVGIPNDPALFPANALTIEAWINPSTYTGCSGNQYRVFHTVRAVLRGYVTFIECSTQRFVGQIFDSSGNSNTIASTAGATFPPNVWTHFAMTWDGSNLRIYVNGVLDNTVATTITAIGTNSDPLRIGNESNFGFKGQIDEVALYSRALSASEIAAIHAAATSGKCKPTATVPPSGQVAWLTGDGDARDSAGTNNGTLQSGAKFVVGKVGQAFSIGASFSGDNIRLASNGLFRNLSNAAVEAWVFPRGSGTSVGGHSIYFEDVGISPGSRLQILRNSNGAIQIFGRDAAGTIINVITPAGVAPLNEWTHFVAVYEAGVGVKIYINGILAATTNNAALTNFSADNSARVRIGASGATDSVFGEFVGDIDEFSIYNRALTADEITSIVNAGIAGKLKQNATVDTNSLVSLWQGENNANDTRGVNNGTFAANTYAPGRVGQAFQTNGGFVSVPDSASLDFTNAYTIEMWVAPNVMGQPDGSAFFACKGNCFVVNDQPYSLGFLDTRNVYLTVGNNSAIDRVVSNSTLPLNAFSHIAGTYDGTTMRLYINGVLDNSKTTSIGTLVNSSLPFTFGGTSFSTTAGIFDEVALYNRALTAAEVRANYEAGNALSTVVGDARISASTILNAGTIQQIPLVGSILPALPYALPTGLFYEIAANVNVPNPTVCFNLPSFTLAQFDELRIYHLENNQWRNRTAISNTYPTLCTTDLPSLSPFAIVRFSPTAASVSIGGRVRHASGKGISRAQVSLTDADGNTRTTLTDFYGSYQFDDVPTGETYIIEASYRRILFKEKAQVRFVGEEDLGIDFVTAE